MNIDNIQEYKRHPRMLELRIILVYNQFANEFGVNKGTEFFRTLCTLFNVNWQTISGIINNVYKIRRLEKTNKKRYRQEVVFLGGLYGHSKYYIANNWLNLALATLYRTDYKLSQKVFLSQEWLDLLDNSVTICGIPTYALEAKRFIDAYDLLLTVVK